MPIVDVLLHDQTQRWLDAIGANRSGSYIFHGPRSVGKAWVAARLAQRLNCQGDTAGLCGPCRAFAAQNHPDYLVIRPQDKPSIVIEQVRQLIQALALSPYYEASQRVVVIDDAHLMTLEAQNALLKLIEEPPANTLFILIAEQLTTLLETVRSRCVAIYFPPLATNLIANLLTAQYGVASAAAAQLAAAAGGAVGAAITLAQHPESAGPAAELAAVAANLPTLSHFERLLAAGRLIQAKADLPQLGRLLQHGALAQLRESGADPQVARDRLEALERFRRQLAAKVAPRVALECLLVAL